MSVAALASNNDATINNKQNDLRIVIEHNDLLNALNHCQGVVERRNTVPILSNVFLQAQDNQILLRSTDLDRAYSETLNAQVQESGTITVPAITLNDIVRKLPGGSQIEFWVEDNQAILKCGRSRFKLPTLPGEDFPDFGETVEAESFELKVDSFKRLLDRTKFAMSTEETRYFLNGIYLHRLDNTLRAVATDGHRLAKADLLVDGLPNDLPGSIIPRKTIAEIRKLLDDVKSETLNISLSDTRIQFAIDQFTLTSKLIDGKFPEYERIIPQNNTINCLVEATSLAKAADRVTTISAEKTRAVKCLFEQNKITLKAHGLDAGQAKEEIEAEFSDEPVEMGFNARYLLDILSQIEDDQCRISMGGNGSPVVIQGEHTEEDLFVLMPMRV